jgi:hypothetical protein
MPGLLEAPALFMPAEFPRIIALGSSVNRGNPLTGERFSDAEGLHCPQLGRGAVGLIEPTTQAPGKEHV